jgi:glycosyltransferase involved in cell wall biosynthesis
VITVSVIIPVRDEAAGIEALLADLLCQTRPPREILVVDTGSSDDTRERVSRVAARDPRVRLLSAPGALPGGGRNAGLAAAAGEWVAFVDGGMRVAREWLADLMRAVDAGAPVDVVLGGLEPVADSRWARAAALAFVPARRPTPEGGQWRGFCLPSSATRLELARAAGFPESLRSGEDLIFFQRLSQRARIGYSPDAIVRWRHAATPAQVWRRFRAYAESSFKADLMRDWFRPLARRYLALALVSGPMLPTATIAFLVARAVVMQKRKPELTDLTRAGRALQVAEVALMLGLIDAATFAAWIAWRRQRRPAIVATAPVNAATPTSYQPRGAVARG